MNLESSVCQAGPFPWTHQKTIFVTTSFTGFLHLAKLQLALLGTIPQLLDLVLYLCEPGDFSIKITIFVWHFYFWRDWAGSKVHRSIDGHWLLLWVLMMINYFKELFYCKDSHICSNTQALDQGFTKRLEKWCLYMPSKNNWIKVLISFFVHSFE